MTDILPPSDTSAALRRRHCHVPRRQTRPTASIEIALVNNMPSVARQSTECQIRSLLSEAAQGLTFRLRTFAPPKSVTSEAGACGDPEELAPLEHLWSCKFDGLIITGTEPRARNMRSEPIWPLLTKLVDWSDEHAISSVWSCLAAHAAVLHMDGIERRELKAKRFGLFECVGVERDGLLAGYPARWSVPHSRYNDLHEDALLSRGYRILVRSAAAGVDTFAKRTKSLHLFLQGHFEYDADSLAREYRRDVKRFLEGGSEVYPELPVDYFSNPTNTALVEFRELAKLQRDVKLLERFPPSAAGQHLHAPWRRVAVQFYRNWLGLLAAHKERDRWEWPRQ